MCYTIIDITSWSDKRDSTRRIAPLDKSGYRSILINPNRVYELIADPNDANKSHFKFYDNYRDRRESWSYVKCNSSVAEIETANDVPFHSNMITLNIHKKNDPTKATVATTIPVECLAYADKYNQDDEHCWIVYYLAGFKRREVLADLTIEQLEDIAETGTTSTTSTTTTEDRN